MENSIVISASPTQVYPSSGTNQSETEAIPKSQAANERGLSKELTQNSPLNEKEAEEVVVQLSSLAQSLQRDLLFSLDESNGGTILKVVDSETDEVIRQIPSEDIRRIKERLREVTGLLFRDST